MITEAELLAIAPHTKTRVADFLEPLNYAMRTYGISDTPLREAMFLAQAAHESGGFKYVRELASGRAYDNRKDLGNTKPEAIAIAARHGSTPGVFWKGHGWFQTTGYDNHCKTRDALGVDCVEHPELLETLPNAARSAAFFWYINDLNQIADTGDFDGVSDRINFGRKTATEGDSNGYADRWARYVAAKKVKGLP